MWSCCLTCLAAPILDYPWMDTIGESDKPSSRKAWTTFHEVLWASDGGHDARARGAHAFAGARAARGHLESLVVTRSVVSGMRSKH